MDPDSDDSILRQSIVPIENLQSVLTVASVSIGA